MVQTKMRLRLLLKGEIIGLLHIENGCIDFITTDGGTLENPGDWINWEYACDDYTFDATEQGILMPDGTWIFGEFKYDNTTTQYKFVESGIK